MFSSDALSNPSSQEYADARNQILDALMDALKQAALDSDSKITDIMVVFLSGGGGTRRRRTTTTTAELDITLQKDVLKLESEVTSEDLQVLYSRAA